ncbi:MAG: MATE family efflux transporter [Coriobacteriia bacterium]|nr:MATE family efflux transporter [Coriobacteriia bacterium]MBS5478776.1 MATE family efflux transporter [Coriobacteriia bacterium]
MHQTSPHDPSAKQSRLGLIHASQLKQYLGYVLPSMAALMLSSVFIILDGVFVGHAVGDAGMAGINVAFPMITLVNAISMGIGMGGAVISSIERGKGDEQAALRATGNVFLVLGIVGIPLALTMAAVAEPVCALMGGSGQTLTEAVHFVRAVAIGTPFQAISLGSIALVRNRGDVRYAMVVQIITTSINIVLDFLFVFELGFGTFGAGLATVFGQVFSFCAYVRYFTRPKNRIPRAAFKPHGVTLSHMVKLGLAPFGLFLLPDVTTVVINVNANAAGGETAVAAFAAMAYVGYIVLMLMQGVADGSQPLVSLCHGKGDHDQVQRLRNTNYAAACGLGLVGLVVLVLMRDAVPGLFGTSEATAAVVVGALPLYALAFVFYGFTHVSMSYFYATDNARASNFLVYGEAVVIVIVAAVLTATMGITGTWLAVAAAQVLLSAIAIVELWAVEHSRRARMGAGK